MSLSYNEDLDAQIPAMQLLHALGWKYLSPEQALHLREGRQDRVVLTGILRPWLETHNRIQVKGETHAFNPANIAEAIRRLTEVRDDGLVRTNETVYELLTLGTSLDQTIDQDRKGRTLHYIDWHHPENNVYHITQEFAVERRRSRKTRRPDLVLLVNGIPFVVIECKRRDKDKSVGERQIEVGIRQMGGYQKDDNIPHLFHYAQITLATSVNDIKYATVGTPRKFWSDWVEEAPDEAAVHRAANTPLPKAVRESLFIPPDTRRAPAYEEAREHFTALWAEGERLPTAQDRMLWAVLRFERLLELVYGYVVFDAGKRKIARYQQFFAVKATLARALQLREGRRTGGVVWHTTGSGKSLSMVMLAKALALQPGIVDPRVVLVTDRIDLDTQLGETFAACGKTPEQASTGEELVRLITEGQAEVITTVINKFTAAIGKQGVKKDFNPNIFVLVDEGHRSNYGPMAARMRGIFPNACFIGFTGTPLTKKNKNTAEKFGGFIHSYTMRQAVADKAVTPLLYEGRMVPLEQDQAALDRWFERITANLTRDQRADLQRKMARREVIHKNAQRIQEIAYDVCLHYRDNFQHTGFKAQLAADSRMSALLYRKFLDEIGFVTSEIIMSAPDKRPTEDEAPIDEADAPAVKRFWDEMMARFGSEKAYLKEIKASFGREDGVEMLIVVDKLLTGFDEPLNTVLYIDKSLKEHNILQAIARVNRLHPGKEFGYVVDYRGVLGELNQAIKVYDALKDYDPQDVDLTDVLTDTREEVARLAQRHTDLWAVFKEVKNRKDNEALERHLAPEDKRQTFYEALRDYQKTLAVALATTHFYDDTPKARIKTYKDDLKFFISLRASVRQRYSEAIDFADYEKQVRKIMDSHIHAGDVGVITELVDIFDTKAFEEELGQRESDAAKADVIASRVKKTATERIEEDPVFYRKFADLVQQAIDDYRQQRIDEAEYLRRVKVYQQTVRRGHDVDIPARLRPHQEAQAYYGILKSVLAGEDPGGDTFRVKEAAGDYVDARSQLSPERIADMALIIEDMIETRKIRDWTRSEDVLKQMANSIDDYLYSLRDSDGLMLTTGDMDIILDHCLSVAKKRSGA